MRYLILMGIMAVCLTTPQAFSMPPVLAIEETELPPPDPHGAVSTVIQLFSHFTTISDQELSHVLLRGDGSLGKCSLRKSSGSSSCKYRLMNQNKTVFCFNDDPNPGYRVIGVAHGNWTANALAKNPLTGATYATPKEYFDNVRNRLSGYADARSKAIGYARSFLLTASNPCTVSITAYMQPANIDITNPNQFTFYKNHLTKEIYCSNNLLDNPVWNPSSCTYQTQKQYFDPRWCKKLYTQFYTRSIVSIPAGYAGGSGGGGPAPTTTGGGGYPVVVPVSPISFATLGVQALKEATIQLIPPEMGLVLEDATTKISFYDVVDAQTLMAGEYSVGELIVPFVLNNQANLDLFARYYKLVKAAKLLSPGISIPNDSINIMYTLQAIPGFLGQITQYQAEFSVNFIDAAKRKMRNSADDRVRKALTSAGFSYDPSQQFFGENVGCSEAIQTTAATP